MGPSGLVFLYDIRAGTTTRGL